MDTPQNPAHTRGLMRPIGWLAGTLKHHNALIRALHNVLTTDRTRSILGQMVGGFVLFGAFFGDTRAAAGQCSELSADVLIDFHKTRGQSRATVDIRTLRVDAGALSAFSDSEIGSFVFEQKLIELVVRGVHAMAIVLYQKVPDKVWVPDFDFHPGYLNFDLYPDGEADRLGYWAEDRILGGVVLFGRGDGDRRDSVYLHPGTGGASLIHRLTDDKRQALLDYLFGVATPAVPEPSATFLPIRCDEDNSTSVDVDSGEAMSIYRDKWDRPGLMG